MSNESSLDKDRLLFTQCGDTILLRCPECTSTKILRHCKIFHNFPALWCHIKREHQDILVSKVQDVAHLLNYLFKAYKWNMFPKWAYSEAKIEPTTTSSSILFDGKPPRIDVLEKLRKIAHHYKGQSGFFLKLSQKQVKGLITVVVGNADQRTMKKYFDCVTKYSKKDMVKGEYDVTNFCNKVGV